MSTLSVDETVMQGSVIWFNTNKGFGFIKPDVDKDGTQPSDIFVHFSGIKFEGYKTLNEGDVVEFIVVQGLKGRLQAEEVRVIKGASTTKETKSRHSRSKR